MRRRKAPLPLPPGDGPMTRSRRKLAESIQPPEDSISNLPDAVLGEIISLLPTRDAARTQILASRWCRLWRSAPLNLDCRAIVNRGDELAGVVSRILSSHQGPGRRLRLDADILDVPTDTLEALLRSDALDNLQELEFSWYLQPPSASVFRFSPTLRVVTIGCCNLLDGTFQGLRFPLLKHLGLEFVSLSECSLQSLIVGCPALESLLIHRCFGFRRFGINSLTLTSIGVDNYSVSPRSNQAHTLQLQELIVDNAPRLERLLLLDLEVGLHVSVVAAPKLETIGFLSDWYYECNPDGPYTILFGSTVIQGLCVESLAMAVHTIKILALRMRTLCLDTVIELLACFPCLEKLYIKTRMGMPEPDNLWRRKHRNLIRCHDIRLKMVVLKSYRGMESQVNFVTFFVLNARMLESMTLHVEAGYYNEEFLAQQRTKLQLQNRASRAAQFQFTTDRCIHSSLELRCFRVLELVDPFETRC